MNDLQWRDRFVTELRMMEVTGSRVGDELKIVQDHLAESGETAEEAFGDPAEYASDLGYTHTNSNWVSLGLIALTAYLVVSLIGDGLVATVKGEDLVIGGGDIIGAAMAVTAACVMIVVLARSRRPWPLFVGLWVITIAASIVVKKAWNPTVLTVTGPAAVVVAAVLLVFLIAVLVKHVRRNRITDPVTGEDMMTQKYSRR